MTHEETGYPTAGLPNINVFYNPKSDDVLLGFITTQAKTGFTVPFGQLLRTNVEEMRQDGLRILLEAFAMYNTDPGTGPSELNDKGSSFYRKHKFICIAFKADENALILGPMDKVYGGHVGSPEKSSKVPLPTTSEDLWNVLVESFNKCVP